MAFVINCTFLGRVMQTYLYTQMPYVIFVSGIIDWKQLLSVNFINLSISLLRDTHFINYSKHRHLFHSKNVCSSLLQGKHLPFSPSPLRLNIFRLFVILSLTQLYRFTPEIFLFSTATFKYIYRAPSDKLDKNSQRTWLIKNFNYKKCIQFL